jgi:hypothetical protein
MSKGMDRAAVEVILGKGVVWVEGEDDLDMTYLADKASSVGLTAEEQSHYDALQELYCTGI